MKEYKLTWKTGAKDSEIKCHSFWFIYKYLGYSESEFWNGVFPYIDTFFVNGKKITNNLDWHNH